MAATLNAALLPLITVCATGWLVMPGGYTIVNAATLLVTLPKALVMITSYWPTSRSLAPVNASLAVAEPENSPPSVRLVPLNCH